MITDNDVKKLKKVFATKDDLKGYVTKDYLRDELRYQKEDILAQIDRSMNKKFEKFKDEILKSVAQMLHIGYDPILDDYEERIKKLEKRIPATA